MALARSTRATVTETDVFDYPSGRISQFCKFFYDYGGEFPAEIKLPTTTYSTGWEIGDALANVSEKILKFLPPII